MSHAELERHLSLEEAERLGRALMAFERLTAGTPPNPAELAGAPVLNAWRRTQVPILEPALLGWVEGHPQLPGSRRVVTSRLLVLDETAEWARTVSRLYRLMAPSTCGAP